MGKWEIRPLAIPKPHNWSSPKFANIVTSWISTHTKNLVTIPEGVSFSPFARNCASKCLLGFFFGFFQQPIQPRPPNRCSSVIHQTMWFCTRMCLFRFRKQKFNIYTLQFSKNRHFWAHFWRDWENFRPENRFTLGVLPCKLPLIVVVAIWKLYSE